MERVVLAVTARGGFEPSQGPIGWMSAIRRPRSSLIANPEARSRCYRNLVFGTHAGDPRKLQRRPLDRRRGDTLTLRGYNVEAEQSCPNLAAGQNASSRMAPAPCIIDQGAIELLNGLQCGDAYVAGEVKCQLA